MILQKRYFPDDYLFLTWKNVHYDPGPLKLKTQLAQHANQLLERRKKMENNRGILEIFGDTTVETVPLVKRASSIGKFDKHRKVSKTIKKPVLGKVDEENFYAMMGVDITELVRRTNSTTSYLKLVFEQNRPVNFFGIRKIKVFDNAELKETKPLLIQREDSGELTMGQVSSKQSKTTFDLRDTVRVSSVTQGAITSLFEDDTETAPTFSSKIKSSTPVLKSDIYTKYVPDVNLKISRTRLYDLFINKYYCYDHPRRKYISDRYPETDMENLIIKKCILNDHFLLKKLINDKSFYSQSNQKILNNIDSKLKRPIDDEKIERPKDKLSNDSHKDECNFVEKKPLNIFEEINSEIISFNGFYGPMIKYWQKKVKINEEFKYEKNAGRIKSLIYGLAQMMGEAKNAPGNLCRLMLQELIESGEHNNLIVIELASSVEVWLDQVLKSLLSRYASIRLEAYLTLTLLFSKPNYVQAMKNNVYVDVIYDVVATVIRCIDLRVTEFDMFYSLLGVITHYVHSEIILTSILQRAPYSKHVELVSKWPRFFYFAFTYWTEEEINTSPVRLARLIEMLEEHYLREPLSRKCIKEAICRINNRFNVNSYTVTVWPKEEEIADL